MSRLSTAWLSVVAAALLVVGAWAWRRQVPGPAVSPLPAGAAAVLLQETYPYGQPAAKPAVVTSELLQQIVKANPFSVQRRAKPPTPEGAPGGPGTAGAAAKAPPPPQFIYKGRVELGSTRRAILADRTSGKTFFLEVGQEVAGFKVLDITETQVLLSNTKTREDVTVALSTATRP